MSLIVTSPDEASLLRSLQSDELRNMRHRQDSQRGRHMVFKTEIVERMKATHGTILNRLADQNRKSEEEMSSRVSFHIIHANCSGIGTDTMTAVACGQGHKH